MSFKHFLTENILKQTKFYHYGKSKRKGIAGTWGSSDINHYKHFGGLPQEFSFTSFDKVKIVDAHGFDSVPSESIYKELLTDEDKNNQEKFEELEEEELFMDLVTALRLKEQGYDGIIFQTNSNLQSMDLRNFTIEELKQNYELAKQGKIGYFN